MKKSIRISSFENINKMAIEKNQTYGMAAPNDFSGNFTRSGKLNQYQQELNLETIDIVKKILLD